MYEYEYTCFKYNAFFNTIKSARSMDSRPGIFRVAQNSFDFKVNCKVNSARNSERMGSVKNRVSLVTGAARGIGLAISKALLDHGGKVSLWNSSICTARCNFSRSFYSTLWRRLVKKYAGSCVQSTGRTGLCFTGVMLLLNKIWLAF